MITDLMGRYGTPRMKVMFGRHDSVDHVRYDERVRECLEEQRAVDLRFLFREGPDEWVEPWRDHFAEMEDSMSMDEFCAQVEEVL